MAPFAAAVVAAALSPFAPQPLIIGPLKLGDLILAILYDVTSRSSIEKPKPKK